YFVFRYVLLLCLCVLFFQWSAFFRELRTVPTRRSSDLSAIASAAASVARMGGCAAGTRVAPSCTARRSKVETGSQAPIIAAVSADRKSTRLNSSHVSISYAVFCLKKKRNIARIDGLGYT